MIKTNFAVLMAERGLKIADVYEDTGISKTTLMALAENTGKGVQFDTVDKLCNYLGIELKDFFVYVPYIWEIYFKEDQDEECLDFIVIKLKTKSSEKDYFLRTYAKHPLKYDFPLDDNSFSLWITIFLEQRDAYDDDDFYDFINNLPIPMKTTFFNQIIELLKDNILKQNRQVSVSCSSLKREIENFEKIKETITLKKGDKIYLSFFTDTLNPKEKALESSKIITI